MTWPPEREAALRTMIEGGATFAEAAKALGTTRSGIGGRCARLGIKSTARPTSTSQVADWFADHDGTVTQCADAFGVTHKTLQKHWRAIRRELGWQAA